MGIVMFISSKTVTWQNQNRVSSFREPYLHWRWGKMVAVEEGLSWICTPRVQLKSSAGLIWDVGFLACHIRRVEVNSVGDKVMI